MADLGVFTRYKGYNDFADEQETKKLAEALAVAKLQQAQQKMTQGDKEASAIEVAKYYAGLDDNGREMFDRSRRAPIIKDTGDNFAVYGNGGLTPIPGGGKTLNPSQDPEYLKQKEQAEIQAKDQAEFNKTYPAKRDSAVNNLKYIDELVGNEELGIPEHPGLRGAVGTNSFLYTRPGGDTASFENRLKQIQGGTFLEAFQSLKGGGAITETEGQKGEAAIARMQTSSSEEEFIKAAKEYRSIVERGLQRLEERGQTLKGGDVADPNETLASNIKAPSSLREKSQASFKGKIPMQAAQMLISNPALAPQFDAKYGAGASAKVLGR